MEHEPTHEFDHEDQFWNALDKTLSHDCDSHSDIDDVLRSYLTLISSCRETFLQTDHDLGRCAFKLQDSPLFSKYAEYIRRQFVQCLIEDDEPHVILVATTFLLTDAQSNERTYELLNEQGAFSRLVDLILSPQRHGHEGLHRLLMELFYEMSRIQKIKSTDLAHIGDDFVKMLFEIIEQVSDDVNDPYHYPTIRVLLVLNEQFMVAAHAPSNDQSATPLTNKVIKVLSAHGSAYKTFGENIILLLNREDETSLQLLTLKLLYLLFTTPPTYEYFYTNDLHVLVDILIRNLLDLPEEASSLRHTYLRVLYPLLEHTQLQFPPHYKREEIRKLLLVLAGGQLNGAMNSPEGSNLWGHFDAVDDTTKRLVKRCQGVTWLFDPESEPPEQTDSPTSETPSTPVSPTSPSKSIPPALPAPRKLKKRNSSKGSTLTIGQYLTPQLEGARHSSLSMMEVAAQKEKPGVITPSRNPGLKNNLRAAIMHTKKERPPLPQARRSGWTRTKVDTQPDESEVNRIANTSTESKDETVDPTDPVGIPTHYKPVPVASQESEKINSSEKSSVSHSVKEAPPPVPANHHHHHRPHFKKPPPTPKARRWRGKGRSEDDGSGVREPGKFNPSLPSIITTSTSGQKVQVQSPFSPLEKTLSPPDTIAIGSNQPKSSVAEALEKAQEKAVDDITKTMEQVDLRGDDVVQSEAGGVANAESKDENVTHDHLATPLTKTDSIKEEEEPVQQFHDAVHTQPERQTTPIPPPLPLTRPPTSRSVSASKILTLRASEDIPKIQLEQDPLQPKPRVILTPPGQQPSRGVPGPQYALERSPFLTDDEVEGDSDTEK